MKYPITFIKIILITFFFVACNNTTYHTEKNLVGIEKTKLLPTLKKIQDSQKPIIGRWVGDCHYEENDDQSYQSELSFSINASYNYVEKTYPTSNCSGDYTLVHQDVGTYTLGDRTSASDGKLAYDFEIHTPQKGKINDEYFMIRFTDKELIFTDKKEDDSQPNGETPEMRNDFFSDKPRIKFNKLTISNCISE